MNHEILHKPGVVSGIFYIKEGDHTVADLTYSLRDNVMTIDHTEVEKRLEGNGIGTRLIKESVSYAKENNLMVNPLCPFAEVLFDQNKDWNDLRAE